MGKNLEEVVLLKEEISKEYLGKEDYKTHILGFGISTIGKEDENHSSSKDYCIRIYVRESSPKLSFRRKYKGVRVYVRYSSEPVIS